MEWFMVWEELWGHLFETLQLIVSVMKVLDSYGDIAIDRCKQTISFSEGPKSKPEQWNVTEKKYTVQFFVKQKFKKKERKIYHFHKIEWDKGLENKVGSELNCK